MNYIPIGTSRFTLKGAMHYVLWDIEDLKIVVIPNLKMRTVQNFLIDLDYDELEKIKEICVERGSLTFDEVKRYNINKDERIKLMLHDKRLVSELNDIYKTCSNATGSFDIQNTRITKYFNRDVLLELLISNTDIFKYLRVILQN